jgi:hypothetical protein
LGKRAGDEPPPRRGGIFVCGSFYQGLAPLAMDLGPYLLDICLTGYTRSTRV